MPSTSTRYVSYEAAQAWTVANGITSSTTYVKTPRPKGIPARPFEVYKTKWHGWRSFLQTGPRAVTVPIARHGTFVTFASAQQWAQANNIQSVAQWRRTPRPSDIPSRPYQHYAKDWISWPDFLGTDNLSAPNRVFGGSAKYIGKFTVLYSTAQAFAKAHGIQTTKAWAAATKPEGFPAQPWLVYPNWVDWPTFLGVSRPKRGRYRDPYLSYNEAKRWAQQAGIRTPSQWVRTKRPPDIPAHPHLAYSSEWHGYPSFLFDAIVTSVPNDPLVTSFETPLVKPSDYAVRTTFKRYHLPKVCAATVSFNPIRNAPKPVVDAIFSPATTQAGILARIGKRDSSKTEHFYALEISQFAALSTQKTVAIPGRPREKRIDIGLRDQKTIIEYDGQRFHAATHDRDVADTAALRNDGWRVIRFREDPLPLLSSDDATVSVYPLQTFASKFEAASRALKHLLAIGVLPVSSRHAILQYLDTAVSTQALFSDAWFTSVVGHDTNSALYAEARAWALAHNISSAIAWKTSEHLPHRLPRRPDVYFAKYDLWPGWAEFLAAPTPSVPTIAASYEEAQAWALANSIQSAYAWTSHRTRPPNLPMNPVAIYRQQGVWLSWSAFLQKETFQRRSTSTAKQADDIYSVTAPATPMC